MDRKKLIEQLMHTFIEEMKTQLRALNEHLLGLEKNATDKQNWRTVFRQVHTMKGAARSVGVSAVETLCHEIENILEHELEQSDLPDQAIFELLFASADALSDITARLERQEDPLSLLDDQLLGRLKNWVQQQGSESHSHQAISGTTVGSESESESSLASNAYVERVGSIGTSSANVEPADDARTSSANVDLERERQSGDGLNAAGVSAWLEDRPGLNIERQVIAVSSSNRPAFASLGSSIRVDSPRLDSLINTSGELLLACQKISQVIADVMAVTHGEPMRADPSKSINYEERQLLHLSRVLHDDIYRLRMVPFVEACVGLERTIRDLAKSESKEIILVIRGGDIELDRAVLEVLVDPLLHLVRNSVDHGIELPGQRVLKGKPTTGTITIAAALSGNMVKITVSDDGQGLDEEAIRSKATSRGMSEISSQVDLMSVLFQPGFSTAKMITSVSGRGMGLDIVKTQVEAINGSISLTSSPGKGTSFCLTVPLTLSLLKALLVTAGGNEYALLSDSVVAILQVKPAAIMPIGGRYAIVHADQPVPIAPLAQLLKRQQHSQKYRDSIDVVVVESAGQRLALVVDAVTDQQEILVKALSSRVLRASAVSAASILPDGEIAFILNTSELIRYANQSDYSALAVSRASTTDTKKRLLVAEDSFSTRSLQKSILESAGYEVELAVDGAEALRILRERGADLVISDVEMPRLDGFALTQAIRSEPKLRTIPVILLTAREKEKDKARGLQVGANAYLAKSSFDQRELLETLRQLL